MGKYAGIDSPAVDALVDEAVRGIGAEVSALRVPHLEGVVLGGGYGRGEGGVATAPDGAERPFNDLDFYTVADDASSPADLVEICARLEPISRKWTARLGIDVDFSPARTYWRMKHDEARLMIQELVRGYKDTAGKDGGTLFAAIERRPAEATPLGEAVRLLMNRGVGLLLAEEALGQADAAGRPEVAPYPAGAQGEVSGFIARNINKCVLGAGDARLVARGQYAWRLEERAKRLSDPLYSAAAEWKFRPRREPVCGIEEARAAWMGAEEEVWRAFRASPEGRHRLYHAARWIVRRRTLGPVATFALDPSARVMREVGRTIREHRPLPDSVRQDWKIFN